MPNLFAFAMLMFWPFMAGFMYRKFDTLTASFWTIVGGYMFLPTKTAIDLPLLPSLGKDEVSAISALLWCLIFKRVKIFYFGKTILQKYLIFLLLLIPFINVYFNNEPMFNGRIWINGLGIYDAISQVFAQYLELLPFIIAISIVRGSDDLTKVIKYLVLAGLFYSPIILFEVRFSPQLHTWIYGFFPHAFDQQVRFGGFRSVGFMGHGLLVSLFCFICVSCAAIQYKYGKGKNKVRNVVILIYLFIVLILSKSVGAFLLATGIVTAIIYFPRLLQKWSTQSINALFFLYPTLAILSLIPYEGLVRLVSDFSIERAQSLDYRFTHERALLEHAYERLFIGWGSRGRNRLDSSITDGYWLIILGKYGVVYFFSLFLLFSSSVFSVYKNNIVDERKPFLIGFALILSGVLFDQLLNASLNHSWVWFLAGILAGSCSIKTHNSNIGI